MMQHQIGSTLRDAAETSCLLKFWLWRSLFELDAARRDSQSVHKYCVPSARAQDPKADTLFFTFPNSSTVGFPWLSEALLTERAFHDTRAVIQRTLLMRFFLKSAWRSRQSIERVAKSTVKDRVCSCRVVLGELFFRFLE